MRRPSLLDRFNAFALLLIELPTQRQFTFELRKASSRQHG